MTEHEQAITSEPGTLLHPDLEAALALGMLARTVETDGTPEDVRRLAEGLMRGIADRLQKQLAAEAENGPASTN
ncbi:hypothetical protein [Streptomyces sp. CAU 1734]|uniref:hypothetical protein n=1 Tax=Streptomyces sp. CAU 1734 TaxID=3140360 RepID=UPI0032617EDB